MNIIPKTDYALSKSSSLPYETLTVWRKWLWFNYGHKEFKVTGFYIGNNKFSNCKFGGESIK